MKLIFYFFIILFLSFCWMGVGAVGFSPSSLEYNLKIGEKECKMINLNSDSETILTSDKWAENKDVEWKTNLFDKDASYHGLTVSYDSELSINERNVEVCLKGDKPGEYHGVLLMTENQVGNSVIQMGVWLKAIIEDSGVTSSPVSSGQSSGSGGGGGGFISKKIENKTKVTEKTSKETLITPDKISVETDSEEKVNSEENLNNNENFESQYGITGAAIGSAKRNYSTILLLLFALAIIAIYVYINYKKEKFV